MKTQMINKMAVAFVASLVCLAGSVSSVNAQTIGSAAPQVRVAPVVGSPMPGSTPRLGFMGQMIYGYGMRVLGTNYGSPAQIAGLERGDVIFSINGRRILSQFDYNNALRQAAMYQGGFVNLTVRNVRYDMGLSYQEFVNVSTRAIGGFGGGGPMPIAGSVALPSSNGTVGQGGMVQGGMIQGGMQVRSAPATRSGQARRKIKEITPDKVPALREGQKGSSQ